MSDFKKTAGNYIFLHITFLIYSLSTLASKFAGSSEWFSKEFIIYTLLVFVMLIIYALLWQKVLKKFTLAKAYPNKAVVVIWNLIWAALILGETITLENIIGSAIIVIGVVVVSGDEE